nr:DUF4433 domain-containing protein [Kistimonas asteriae]
MTVPPKVRLFRLTHIDNLDTLLRREALHAPLHTPHDGLPYRTIHDASIQEKRYQRSIPCGPSGVIHDYLPFYLGPLSPMLYKLGKGGVEGYDEGEEPLIYLIARAEEVASRNMGFVFSDGHGIAAFTQWFDTLDSLGKLDWPVILGRVWADTTEDNDRKRRKQAEFLIHKSLPWDMIQGIAVLNEIMADKVKAILAQFPDLHHPPVHPVPQWYYQGG